MNRKREAVFMGLGILAGLALSGPATSITATLNTQPIYVDGQRVDSPSWEQIRPGDLIRYDNSGNGHVVVVVKKTKEHIKVTESGLNNKVR